VWSRRRIPRCFTTEAEANEHADRLVGATRAKGVTDLATVINAIARDPDRDNIR